MTEALPKRNGWLNRKLTLMKAYSEEDFDVVPFESLLAKVRIDLRRQPSGRAAFTLLIGAGFSAPLIPTTREMVERDIAWWLFCREKQVNGTFSYCESIDEDLREFTAKLWTDIYESCGRSFRLDGVYPDLVAAGNINMAYQAAMSGKSVHGLSTAQLRRQYIRDVGRRVENKINSAHLYLASILQSQDEWQMGGPFCKTIFTTNFDPLLQRSLQLVGKLYYMTDSPDLLELPEDDGEAIHLIYCHGSMHRHILLNTRHEIESARVERARYLIPYFERHGVIAIGHSGWHDVVIEALLQCKTFDGNLYWCDIHPAAEARDRLNEGVKRLLGEHRGRAFYVPIPSADALMLSAHISLGLGTAPQFTIDPMKQTIRNLKSIDVSNATLELPGDSQEMDTLTRLIERTLQRLGAAKQVFDEPERLHDQAVLTGETAQVIEQALTAKRMNDAFMATARNNWQEAIASLTAVINDDSAMIEEQANALINRGTIYLERENPDLAIDDFSAVIDMPSVSAERKAKALLGRGASFMAMNDSEGAVEDYTKAIDIPGLSEEQRAKALMRRAYIYWLRRGHERGRMLMEGVRSSNLERAIEDYGRVLAMTNISLDFRAKALCNRGICFEVRNDLEAALRDFLRVIGWQNVSPQWRARALAARGSLCYKQDRENVKSLLDDSRAALSLDPTMKDVRLSLGLGLLLAGRSLEALEEYKQAVDLPMRLYTAAIEDIRREQNQGRIAESEDVSSIIMMIQQQLGTLVDAEYIAPLRSRGEGHEMEAQPIQEIVVNGPSAITQDSPF